jgi:hypothetical protein
MLTNFAILMSILSSTLISALPVTNTADSPALNLTMLVTSGVTYTGIVSLLIRER